MTLRWPPRLTILSPVLCLLLLMGCGDDDGATNDNQNLNQNDNTNDNTNQNSNGNDFTPYTGDLDDLNGYYEMTAVTFRPSSTDIEVTREPASVALPEIVGAAYIRGHGEVLATSATGGELDLRWVVIGDDLFNGYLARKWGNERWTASWEPAESKLVLDASAMTAVYLLGQDSDVITLLRDDSDPRTNTAETPVRFDMTAAPRPTAEIAGTWDIQSMQVSGYREYLRTTACSPLDPDDPQEGSHGSLIGTAQIDDTGWITQEYVATTYDSSDCSGTPVEVDDLVRFYYFEIDENADTFEWYYSSRPTGSFTLKATSSYTLDGTTLTTSVIDHHANAPVGNYSYVDTVVYTAVP